MKKGKVLGYLIVVALLGGFILLSQSVYNIQFGTVGIVTRFGRIVEDSKLPGFHLKIPFIDEVLVYRTQKIVYQTLYHTSTGFTNSPNSPSFSYGDAVQNTKFVTNEVQPASYADYEDVAVDTTTKDGQQVRITYSIRFSLDPSRIRDIANTLGTESDVVEKIIKTDSRVWSRNIPRNYSALDLYTGNIDKVSEEIKEILRPVFTANGIILDEFYIRSIHFTEQYVQIIEEKQIEKEKIATEEFKAQQEEFRKKALITRAEGEAEAQRLQQLTLTKELIQKLWIEKWDGKLPTTLTGDSGLLLNIGR